MAETPGRGSGSAGPERPGQTGVGSKTATRRRILVVENDAAIRSMLVDLLSDEGYFVMPAADGTEGLSILRERQPDLVVLDLMLPAMSGWQFLDRCHAELERRHVPVIVVSAIDGRGDYPVQLGAAAWFSKQLAIPRFLRTVDEFTGRLSSKQSTSLAAHATPKRVLIVENEPLIRDLLAEYLTDEGYRPDTAATIAEALARIEAQEPDLILLDLMLSVDDGWSFLKSRKEHPSLARIPVLVVSASSNEALLEARDLGADGILAKPFDLDALMLALRSLVEPTTSTPAATAT